MSNSAGDVSLAPASSTMTRFTATTTWTAYPALAGDKIMKFIVDSDIDNSGGRRIWVAYSSGASDYVILAPGDSLEEIVGDKTQIWSRTASNTATGTILFSFG